MHVEGQGNNNLIDQMFSEANRLKTFEKWPFPNTVKCSAAKMAEAGFFHCPTEDEKDLVQCFVCHKRLHGWEPDEEPWAEHLSHMKECVFAKLQKPEKDLTLAELYDIEAERKINKIKMITAQRLDKFKNAFSALQDFYEECFQEIQNTRDKRG